jgi:hypothetical protein
MPMPPAERARLEEEISAQAKEIEMKIGRLGGVGPKQKAEIEVEIQEHEGALRNLQNRLRMGETAFG